MTPTSDRLVIVDALLIDAGRPEPELATLVVENGLIADIISGGGRPPSGEGGRTIDADGATLIPGLWDIHTHLESPGAPAVQSVADLTLRYTETARRGLLRSGVVAVRTAGLPHFIDVSLRNAIEAGQETGPRIFAGGYFLTTTGGHVVWRTWALECDGPVGFVRTIREHIKSGVDHIKVNLSGGIMGPSWDLHTHSYWLEDELDAAFEIARLRGYKVMAHATNPVAVKSALRRGAHSVEHGYIMDEECIDLLLETDTWYVPTLCISHLTANQASSCFEHEWVEDHALPADLAARADAASDTHRHWFRRALDSGVKMAVGSDTGPLETAVFQEMELWVKDGATPHQTIVGATLNAASLCGVGNVTGSIDTGKRADLVVLERNPLEDINNIRSVAMVVKDGRVVADHRQQG